jgi:hypothetical protein
MADNGQNKNKRYREEEDREVASNKVAKDTYLDMLFQ